MKPFRELLSLVFIGFLFGVSVGFVIGEKLGADSANRSWTKDMLDRGFAEIAFDENGVGFWRWKKSDK